MHRIILKKKGKNNWYNDSKKNIDKYDSDESLSSDDEKEVSKDILGNIFQHKYLVLKYLSRGTFSRVWLVLNLDDNNFYAMKTIFTEYYEDSKQELRILNILYGEKQEYSNLIKVYDKFYQDSTLCIINELMGITLLDFIENYNKTIPINILKLIIRNILTGLSEIHNKNIIHTDLKLENIMINIYKNNTINLMEYIKNINLKDKYNKLLLESYPKNIDELSKDKKKKIKRKCKEKIKKKFILFYREIYNNYLNSKNLEIKDLSEIDIDIENINSTELIETDFKFNEDNFEDYKIKIIDFGNAEIINDKLQDEIQISSYRSPENIINDYYCTKSDIWTLGCLIFEMVTQENLIKIKNAKDSLDKDRKILYEMYRIIGKMPKEITDNCDFSSDLFDSKGRIQKYRNVEYTSIYDLLLQHNIEKNYSKEISDFLKFIFIYDPNKRLSANELLRNTWLT